MRLIRNRLKRPIRILNLFTRNLLVRFFQFFKVEIKKLKPSVLNRLKIGYVIDVGAYQGQFVRKIRQEGYKGQIYSFEPLLKAHNLLLKTSLRSKKWEVHEPVALGSMNGIATLNISANPTSSSITEMLPAHLIAAPYSYKTGEQQIKVITLDSMINQWRMVNSPIYLKIDTQGYEYEVLMGGQETLNLVSAVQIELSIEKLYQGQKLYMHFIEFFEKKNFILYSILPGFCNSKNGQLLQFDAIFVRSDYLNQIR